MTVDTYVLSDQVVLKNGNIMTQPEVVAELNSQARAALARGAELDQALAEKDPFGAKLNRISEKLERCNALLVARAAQAGQVPQAWLDVQAERRRQIEAKGWTPEHDDLYCSAELPRSAAAYIRNGANDEAPAIWPFSAKWWKPRDARANYVRAAALILAEIERLDRAASLLSQEVPPCAEH
ncbi:hypothetical protein ACP5IR_001182 [Pseudomonas aeruginosa]